MDQISSYVRLLRAGTASVCALLLFFSTSCYTTVQRAEKAFTPSVKEEKKMGREFARKAIKELPLVENPEVVEYVYRIGQPIVRAIETTRYRFRFHVVKNPSLNAFAVPGGHIYLFSGLLLKARSAQEVAGVIAHELSHVTHRHTAKMIGKGTVVSLATLAAVIAAGVSGAGQVGTLGALGAGQAVQLSFSRKFESQADRSALFYLYQARYDPHGLMDFFDMLQREQTFSTSRVPAYLLTHPVTSERMDQIENLIRLYRLEVRNPREMSDYYRFQTLLRIETEDSTRVMPLLKKQVEENPADAASWHRLGLALDRFGWTEEAFQALGKAVALDSKLYPAWMDLAYLESRLGKLREAEAHFQRAAQLQPDYALNDVRWAEMLLKLDQKRDALRLLRKALELEPTLIRAHKLIAGIWKEMGDNGGFHEEMASYYEKMDNAAKAVFHLQEALKIYGESSDKGKGIQKRIQSLRSF